MKVCVVTIVFLSSLLSGLTGYSQSQEVQQLLLNVEKLAQFKSILADMKKGYQVVSAGYNGVKRLTEGTFDLHKTFLDGLLQVSPVVRSYKRVGDIVSTQLRLVTEYRKVLQRFRQNGKFTSGELDYMASVYGAVFHQSLENLDALAKVLTPGALRMSDAERIAAIDTIWKEVEDGYTFFTHFTGEANVLCLQRTNEGRETHALKDLYHIQH